MQSKLIFPRSIRYLIAVAEHHSFTRAADVYSFATVLWETMAWKKPFENYTPTVFLRAIADFVRGRLARMVTCSSSAARGGINVAKAWRPAATAHLATASDLSVVG